MPDRCRQVHLGSNSFEDGDETDGSDVYFVPILSRAHHSIFVERLEVLLQPTLVIIGRCSIASLRCEHCRLACWLRRAHFCCACYAEVHRPYSVDERGRLWEVQEMLCHWRALRLKEMSAWSAPNRARQVSGDWLPRSRLICGRVRLRGAVSWNNDRSA
jgi:hypothetical protein